MMKLKSVFKFGDLDNQEEVYNGGVISILLAIGRHLWLSITNIVKALGYTLYLVTWLIYIMTVIIAIGFVLYYIYLVALVLF
ncbi:hypothetical protein O3802_01475 [Gemella sp. 27098_8_92]|uniref:hypothetical protein n=1 Tax=Gemella sp. 27098_8_92 TaxID=3003687 RepID=UPI00352D4B7D